ncbi:MAG: PAS domain S-box protein [Gammaproteobacteria bacterium]
MLCPIIAQPDGGLRAPADPELADLATRIRARVQLSTEEQGWLATRPRVHVRVGDYPPFHFVADGVPQGLSVDYVSTFCAVYELDCDFVPGQSVAQTIASMTEPGGIAIAPAWQRTADREQVATFLPPHVSSPFVIFRRERSDRILGIQDLRGLQVVVEQGYPIEGLLRSDYPGLRLIEVNGSHAAVKHLATGQADAYVGSLMVGHYLIEELGLSNLLVAAPTPYAPNELEIAVRKDWPVLAALIDRAQGAMTHDEHLSLRNRWSNIRISGFISRERVLLLGSVAAASIVTLLLIGALLINRRMRRDIKDRRDSERDLQISQSRLREAMVGTETGLWEWNPQTGKVYLDPVWFTMLGYDPDTMPHTLETFEALVHPDDLSAVQATMAALSADPQERIEAEFRMRCRDGSYRWVHSKGSLLETDQDGKAFRLIGIHTDVTRQKDTERALRESEKGLLKVQEMARLGSWAWDVRNDRITWSDEVYRIYGIGRETPLTYERLMQAIHPGDRQYHDEHTAGWLKNLGGDPFEYRIIRPDGETRYINGHGEVTCDESGEPVSLSGFLQDITARKLREQALRESEQRFRRLVEQSPMSIQIHGLDGKLLQSNAAFVRLYALNEEALAQLYEKYSVLQDEQAVKLGLMPYIEQTYRGEDVAFPVYEYDGIDTLQTLDVSNPVSRKCWVQTRGFPLKDVSGSFTSVVFMSEDITEQKVAEEQLRISEIRFRATFEQAAVGIAHVALDGRFLRINRKFSDITGYLQDEMMQLAFQDITCPDDLDADLAYARQLLEGEIESYTMEKRYVRKDAGLVWVSLTGSLIRDAAGQPDWFVAVVQDISERRRAEQKVMDYQQRLKSLSTELARTEERERRIIATELHDNVGQSLAVMRMQLAVAGKETAGRKVGSLLDEVSESLRTAIQDTRNIMSELSSPALNELGLAAAIAEFLREKISARYGLQTSFYDDDGQVNSLNEYTRMVLFRSVRELLMNVVKHAGASHVTVSIQREDNAVKIIVEDDGAGMPATIEVEHPTGEGGFGLFSIEERMHDFGGSLLIESSPGKGVRAVLIAPLDEE